VATLGTLGMAQGLCLIVSDGQSVVGIPRAVRDIYSATLAGLPVPVVVALIAYAVFHVLLYHTRFGTYIFALGGNREALRYAGLSPAKWLIGVYTIGGLMAGIAGLLMTARMNAGHPTAGLGLEFDAIAAVAVGGTSFERGNGWLFGTMLGVIAVGVLRNGLNLLALPSSLQVASVGFLVIVALFLDGLRSRS
jgi:ribose transport system permease protein